MKRVVVFAICFFSSYCGCKSETQVFYHRGLAIDQIVFYCPCQPEVTSSGKKVIKHGVEYICEHIVLHGCCAPEQQLQRVSSLQAAQDYHIKMERRSEDLVLDVFYVPDRVFCSLHTFTSIQRSAGVAVVLEKKLSPRRKKQLAPVVVIDPGHGGHDCGALGVNNVCEKIVTLDVGRSLFCRLKELGYDVRMTRDDDIFVPLDERTSCANVVHQADLFISLHVNNSPKPHVTGIETFCTQGDVFLPELSWSSNKDAGSRRLAQMVQQAVLESCSQKYPVENRGVKRSASHVMFGTEMPAVLIELGFNSNALEAARLVTDEYQESLADAIASAVDAFLKT
jgi:N-acetylmuramoyl-L-alanine amidase